MIENLNIENYNEFCKNDAIVVFYTRWCPVCKMLLFKLEEYSDENPNVKIGKFDVSSANLDEFRINVKNVPLTIIYKDEKITDRFNGMFEIEDLEEIISH